VVVVGVVVGVDQALVRVAPLADAPLVVPLRVVDVPGPLWLLALVVVVVELAECLVVRRNLTQTKSLPHSVHHKHLDKGHSDSESSAALRSAFERIHSTSRCRHPAGKPWTHST